MSFFSDEDHAAFRQNQQQVAHREVITQSASEAEIIPLYDALVDKVQSVFRHSGIVQSAYCRVDYPPESRLLANYLEGRLTEYFARTFGVPSSQFNLKVRSMILEGSGDDIGIAICMDIRFDPPLT